jgi:hypothetical protein
MSDNKNVIDLIPNPIITVGQIKEAIKNFELSDDDHVHFLYREDTFTLSKKKAFDYRYAPTAIWMEKAEDNGDKILTLVSVCSPEKIRCDNY